MRDVSEPGICEFCKHAAVFNTMRELAFSQLTYKGSVSCRVNIPVATCQECGAVSWDHKTEAMIEDVVKRETDALQNGEEGNCVGSTTRLQGTLRLVDWEAMLKISPLRGRI
jgi:hypothetical protein